MLELSQTVESPISTESKSLSQVVTKPAVQSSSVLLDSAAFETNQHPLMHHVQNNRSVDMFLRLMGIIWFSKSSPTHINALQYGWNVLIRSGLVLLVVYSIYLLVSFTSDSYLGSTVIVLLALTLILQVTALCFALFEMKNRLNATVNNIFKLYLNSGLTTAYLVFFLSFCIASLPIFVSVILVFGAWFTVAITLGEFSICCLLTATMYFISTDCAVASSLLDQLIEQQKLELLTFEQYTRVRKEVDACQSSSQWINNSIVIVAMLDVATVLIFLFAEDVPHTSAGVLVGFLGFLLKELPFLFVVYWQVAQVNEKSARFLKDLSVTRWNTESQSESERVAIFVSATGSPIVMSLAGMKLKRKDLAWQFAVWCFTLVVSIVKASVVSDA